MKEPDISSMKKRVLITNESFIETDIAKLNLELWKLKIIANRNPSLTL